MSPIPESAGVKPGTRLFLASRNAGKLREFSQAALARGIQVDRLPGIERWPAPLEDGETFEANARKKAASYSNLADGLIFADDSGIAVDALDGRPGVVSARFAGPEATDADNNAKLLDELRRAIGPDALDAGAVPAAKGAASAHYVCVIALAERGQVLTVTEGRADGIIIASPRGTGGFGYDPHFFFPPLGKTFAELDPEAKFAVSHRGEAFRKLLDYLEQSPETAPSS